VTPETASRVSPLTIIEIVGDHFAALKVAAFRQLKSRLSFAMPHADLISSLAIASAASAPLDRGVSLAEAGELTARRAGGTVYFVREEIDALINRMIEEARKEVAW
jgi:hypothetical protein